MVDVGAVNIAQNTLLVTRIWLSMLAMRIVLLSAPGFAGRTGEVARAFHGVDRVQGGRLSLGLRVECQKK